MNVLIAGGGRVGSHLTRLLLSQGHMARLIEARPEVLAQLHRELPTEAIFEGDPTNPQTLKVAGAQQAHVVAVVTTDDADNLVIASLARFVFAVKRVISRVNNPRNAWLFTPEFGVDVCLNQADIMANLIQEEMSLGDMMTLLKLRRGQYSVVEEKIHPRAAAVGVAIRDLPLSGQVILSGILRHGEMVLPRGPTVLEAGDEILALVDDDGRRLLARLLGQPEIVEPVPV